MLPLIEQKISALFTINNELTELEYQKFSDDAFELLDLIKEVHNTAKGSPALIELITDSNDESKMHLVERYFPYAAISRATGVKITILPPYDSQSK